MECTEYWAFGFSDPPPLFLEHSPKSDTQMSPWPLTKSHLDSPLGNNQTYIAAWWKGKKQKQKTYSILYHGPVWITLNSFIWNIKTMKHKPSTKSDSYKCRIIRLLKMNRLYWKTTVFFFLFEWWSRYTKQIVRCEHDYAIYTLQILPDRRRGDKEKRTSEEKQKKMEQRYSSDFSLLSLWQWLRPQI